MWWPDRWPLSFLLSIRHNRAYRLWRAPWTRSLLSQTFHLVPLL